MTGNSRVADTLVLWRFQVWLVILLAFFYVASHAANDTDGSFSVTDDTIPDEDTSGGDDKSPTIWEMAKKYFFQGLHDFEATSPLVFHVIFMMLGWGLLIPSGVITAFFLRPNGGTTEGWFTWHLSLNALGLAFALIGWFTALFNFDALEEKGTLQYKHGVMGVFTMCVGLLQPINALMRPSSTYVFRKTWKWIHKMAGVLALLSSIVTILLGMQLVTFTSTVRSVYLGIVAFLSLLALGLWCHQRRLRQQYEREHEGYTDPHVEMKPIVTAYRV